MEIGQNREKEAKNGKVVAVGNCSLFPKGFCLFISALWSGTNKNQDVSTGPLALPFARSLSHFARSFARSWDSECLDVSK